MVWWPSVTLKVTVPKFGFVFWNRSAESPMLEVPTTLRVTLAVPSNEKSASV